MQYNVLTNLKHNGFRYVPGALIELEDVEAAKLVKDGVIEPFTGRPEPVSTKKKDTETEGSKKDKTTESNTTGNTNDPGGDKNDSEGEKPLEDLHYSELQKIASNLGLKSVGVGKNALVESIRAAQAAADQTEGDNGNEDDNADDL